MRVVLGILAFLAIWIGGVLIADVAAYLLIQDPKSKVYLTGPVALVSVVAGIWVGRRVGRGKRPADESGKPGDEAR